MFPTEKEGFFWDLASLKPPSLLNRDIVVRMRKNSDLFTIEKVQNQNKRIITERVTHWQNITFSSPYKKHIILHIIQVHLMKHMFLLLLWLLFFISFSVPTPSFSAWLQLTKTFPNPWSRRRRRRRRGPRRKSRSLNRTRTSLLSLSNTTTTALRRLSS